MKAMNICYKFKTFDVQTNAFCVQTRLVGVDHMVTLSYGGEMGSSAIWNP